VRRASSSSREGQWACKNTPPRAAESAAPTRRTSPGRRTKDKYHGDGNGASHHLYDFRLLKSAKCFFLLWFRALWMRAPSPHPLLKQRQDVRAHVGTRHANAARVHPQVPVPQQGRPAQPC
jgi:hypothetical protein